LIEQTGESTELHYRKYILEPIPRGQSLDQQATLPMFLPVCHHRCLNAGPTFVAAEEKPGCPTRASVSVAKKAFFPRISLTGTAWISERSAVELFAGPSRAWTFVPQVTQPIFTGGRLKSDVKFAKAQQEFASCSVPANDSERV
jgi:multidrug efflux system outer membrane protein